MVRPALLAVALGIAVAVGLDVLTGGADTVQRSTVVPFVVAVAVVAVVAVVIGRAVDRVTAGRAGRGAGVRFDR